MCLIILHQKKENFTCWLCYWSKNIYLSTSNGRLLIIDIATGKTKSTLKVDNEKISRPLIINKNLFIIKDNAIVKLN